MTANSKTVESLLSLLLAGDVSVLPVLEDAIHEAGGYLMIEQKGWTRGGVAHPAKRITGRYAVVTPGKSIRIVGVAYPAANYGSHQKDWTPAQHVGAYDRTFEIGDVVEYDSYNLSFHGKITSIGKSGQVKVAHPHSKRSTVLDAERFTSRNWDLDLAQAAERNHEASMNI